MFLTKCFCQNYKIFKVKIFIWPLSNVTENQTSKLEFELNIFSEAFGHIKVKVSCSLFVKWEQKFALIVWFTWPIWPLHPLTKMAIMPMCLKFPFLKIKWRSSKFGKQHLVFLSITKFALIMTLTWLWVILEQVQLCFVHHNYEQMP